MTDEPTKELILTWAQHAAIPFQGHPCSSDVATALKVSITKALSIGGAVIPGLSDVEFAYRWDDKNEISVVMDPGEFLEDDLVIGRQ